MAGIEVIDTKNVIKAIKQKHGYDFSQHALTSLRYAIDRSVVLHHFKYPELLVTRILEDEEFFEDFLYEITFVSPELFRDFPTWISIKNSLLPAFFDTFKKPRIWFPDLANSQDLISFLIVMKASFPLKKLNVLATSVSTRILESFNKGEITSKQLEAATENFVKVFPGMSIATFMKPNGKNYHFDFSEFHEIQFRKQNLVFAPCQEKFELIFFRNKLIKYFPSEKVALLDILMDKLVLGGYLILGIKENIDNYIEKHKSLKLVDEEEKIYKKVLA